MFKHFVLKIHAIYDIMWKNTVEPGRPPVTLWRCSLHDGYQRLQTHTEVM
jgi:hypothetical protein